MKLKELLIFVIQLPGMVLMVLVYVLLVGSPLMFLMLVLQLGVELLRRL